MSAIDTLGLWWDLTFDVKKEILEGVEYDKNGKATGNTISCHTFAGHLALDGGRYGEWEKDIGPIPKGEYLIMQPDKRGWYPLFVPKANGKASGNVEVTDPMTKEKVIRDQLYLHEGEGSDGCVTVRKRPHPSGNGSQFDFLRKRFIWGDPYVRKGGNYEYKGKLLVK